MAPVCGDHRRRASAPFGQTARNDGEFRSEKSGSRYDRRIGRDPGRVAVPVSDSHTPPATRFLDAVLDSHEIVRAADAWLDRLSTIESCLSLFTHSASHAILNSHEIVHG